MTKEISHIRQCKYYYYCVHTVDLHKFKDKKRVNPEMLNLQFGRDTPSPQLTQQSDEISVAVWLDYIIL